MKINARIVGQAKTSVTPPNSLSPPQPPSTSSNTVNDSAPRPTKAANATLM